MRHSGSGTGGKVLVAAMFAVLAGLAFVFDHGPGPAPSHRPSGRPGLCIDWYQDQWVQFKCPG